MGSSMPGMAAPPASSEIHNHKLRPEHKHDCEIFLHWDSQHAAATAVPADAETCIAPPCKTAASVWLYSRQLD